MKTIFINNIEYIEAPPLKLKKAMERERALRLIRNGELRLCTPLYYRKVDPNNSDQMDPYEDIGIKICQGVECSTESGNPSFIWCCADMKAEDQKLLNIDKKYDTILIIDNPQGFFELICHSLREKSYQFLAQAGFLYYDKGKKENRYFWGDNTFQKHEKYSYQEEFRISVRDLTFACAIESIDLQLVNCSSFLSLRDKGEQENPADTV